MLRIDEIQRNEMEVAEAKRYLGKTKWGMLLIFSVSQVGHKASTFGPDVSLGCPGALRS